MGYMDYGMGPYEGEGSQTNYANNEIEQNTYKYGRSSYLNHGTEDPEVKDSQKDPGGRGQRQSSTATPVDKCDTTRKFCATTIVIASLLALAGVTIGTHLLIAGDMSLPSFLRDRYAQMGINTFIFERPYESYIRTHWACSMPRAWVILIPLILNVTLTAVFEGLNCIDSTVLKWALWEEGRLNFTSNPRLFAVAKHHPPCSWYANLLSSVCIVFAYGSTAVLTTSIRIIAKSSGTLDESEHLDGSRYGIDFSGWAILILGVCIQVKLMLSAWCLLWKPELVKTWSTNPLMTAKACCQSLPPNDRTFFLQEYERQKEIQPSFSFCGLLGKQGARHRKKDRKKQRGTIVSLVEFPKTSEAEISLRFQQLSAREAVPTVRRITALLWLLFAGGVICITVVAVYAVRSNSARPDYVSEYKYPSEGVLTDYWKWYGQVWFRYTPKQSMHHPRYWLGVILQSLFQAPLTLALHCSSLLLSVHRDERTWHMASSPGGAPLNMNPFIASIRNWPAIGFILYASIVQWIFGWAVSVNLIILIRLIPFVVLAFLILLLAVFSEIFVRIRPKRLQPAIWGDLRRLIPIMRQVKEDRCFWVEASARDAIPASRLSIAPIDDMGPQNFYHEELRARRNWI